MTANDLRDALRGAAPAIEADPEAAFDHPALIVAREALVPACRFLRDSPALAFQILSDATAVDRWPIEPRFEVVYHLASESRRCRLRLKVRLSENDASVPTISGLWPGANWLEREIWDLFGIRFEGHGDLTRLLMPEDWEGHPLRKDYPVQIRMAAKVYEPLQLTEEEFRRNVTRDWSSRQSVVREVDGKQ
jgi:NADH-quinone oxidoreductase subunit C